MCILLSYFTFLADGTELTGTPTPFMKGWDFKPGLRKGKSSAGLSLGTLQVSCQACGDCLAVGLKKLI